MMYPKPSLRSSERGLKYLISNVELLDVPVAPFVGAWIEILFASLLSAAALSRSVRRSVD